MSNIGICYYNLETLKDSSEWFLKSLEEDKTFFKPRLYLAKIYEQKKEWSNCFD